MPKLNMTPEEFGKLHDSLLTPETAHLGYWEELGPEAHAFARALFDRGVKAGRSESPEECWKMLEALSHDIEVAAKAAEAHEQKELAATLRRLVEEPAHARAELQVLALTPELDKLAEYHGYNLHFEVWSEDLEVEGSQPFVVWADDPTSPGAQILARGETARLALDIAGLTLSAEPAHTSAREDGGR